MFSRECVCVCECGAVTRKWQASLVTLLLRLALGEKERCHQRERGWKGETIYGLGDSDIFISLMGGQRRPRGTDGASSCVVVALGANSCTFEGQPIGFIAINLQKQISVCWFRSEIIICSHTDSEACDVQWKDFNHSGRFQNDLGNVWVWFFSVNRLDPDINKRNKSWFMWKNVVLLSYV